MNFPQLFYTPKKAVTKFPITYTQKNNINTFDSKKLFHLSSIKVYAYFLIKILSINGAKL